MKPSNPPTLAKFTDVRRVETLSDLLTNLSDLADQQDRWLFRGQPDAKWGLQPSIERVIVPRSSSLFAVEEFVSHEFKRRAHHYLKNVPAFDDELAWMALMRHHGAPSRLVDWTRSPYVAAAFAAFDARPETDFAIWVVDRPQLEEDARALIVNASVPELSEGLIDQPGQRRDWQYFVSSRRYFKEAFFRRRPKPIFFVAPVEPYHTGERMTMQQGMFLCASSLAFRFETLLASMLRPLKMKGYLIRLVIDASVREPLLAELDRMNITEATLFPGLDGFARSLRMSAEIDGRARAGMPRLLFGDRSAKPSRES